MAWVSPTGFNDPDGNWGNEIYAYDEDIGTSAGLYGASSHYLELTHSAILCNQVRIHTYWEFEGQHYDPDIDIDVFYGDAWHNIFSGYVTCDTWVTKAIGSTQTVTKARIKHNAWVDFFYVNEFDFWEIPGVTHYLAGVISGVASVSGLALITRGLAGLASGVCGVSGLALITRGLTGITQGVALTTASLTVRGIKYLAGIVSGVASVSGFIKVTRALAGASSGIASTAADLTNLKWLRGAAAGVCSTVGSLPVLRTLAGAAAGAASVAGDLGVWVLLKGLSAGVATVTGSLFHVRRAIRVPSAVRNLLAERNIPPVR